MAEKKISELTAADYATDGMQIPVNASGTTKRINVSDLPVHLNDIPPDSADSIDDEFDGTSLDTSTKWTVETGAVTNWTVGDGVLKLNASASNGAISQAISGSAWSVEYCLALPFGFNATNNTSCAIFAMTGTKQVDFGHWRNGSGLERFYINRFNNWAWSSAPTSQVFWSIHNYMLWHWNRLTLASGVLTFSHSSIGTPNSFTNLLTENVATWLGSSPTKVGFFINTQSAMHAYLRYFRRIS